MLAGDALTVWRGEQCLFADLRFRAEPGTVLGLRGPNGSGKTTLLRVIAGLTLPDAGMVSWCGLPLSKAQRDAEIVAYAGHSSAVNPVLTVAENLQFFGRLQGVSGDAVQAALEETGLESRQGLLVRYLSAGQRRRLALARLAFSRAPLWLLDEPQANLDDRGTETLAGLLSRHLGAGGTAVIASHLPIGVTRFPVLELRLGTAS